MELSVVHSCAFITLAHTSEVIVKIVLINIISTVEITMLFNHTSYIITITPLIFETWKDWCRKRVFISFPQEFVTYVDLIFCVYICDLHSLLITKV